MLIKITENEGKVPSITSLATTTSAINAVKNKIPNVSDQCC